ncbi:hypothetical protein [Microbacterium sp. WCS2018Hpa-9]|uniref:hypothetical protein n=1 Tax=Microbacterium sp. WCS2018Hpa-9 TaxID=3073635 RepID=UPI00288B2A42|nr:hypothetical protein [Microbacterium sp. WCS2018Hpa-9]
MENVLLSVHVVAGILFIGPVAVTTSLFPRFAPSASSTASAADAPVGGVEPAKLLHRITRTYGIMALTVPLVGLVLAAVQGRLGEIWITIAMVLTAVAGALLVLRIVPAQRDALGSASDPRRLANLRALTGVFNLMWVAVVVIMIVRPGAE